MAMVDPDDDGIRRYVVSHYRYDVDRHERRHVVVAAFDRAREFEREFERLVVELRERRDAGAVTDPQEHITGVVLEPRHRELAQNGRILGRAISHGVVPRNLDELELPSNVVWLRAERR
ncbi:MAG: hypothetical protein JWP74_988 [Marmoricola sp.]|nr:hypothetical protein [Marmoricola sp.]